MAHPPQPRTYHHGDFSLAALLGAKEAKGTTVSVCIPARTTQPTVAPSSRAGMQTDTVVPLVSLASSRAASGKSAW